MKLEAQIIIKNEFGEFIGEKIIIDQENLSKIIEVSKDFYKSNGFELHCEDGSFVVFPSDIIRRSILRIISKKIE